MFDYSGFSYGRWGRAVGLLLDDGEEVFFAHHQQFVALSVKVGDRVLFGKYSGQTVKVDGDELLVMREEDLFAVVEK